MAIRFLRVEAIRLYMSGGHLPPALLALYTEILP
jgi:hypothetical protein